MKLVGVKARVESEASGVAMGVRTVGRGSNVVQVIGNKTEA